MKDLIAKAKALKAVHLTCDWHGDDGKDAMEQARAAIAAAEGVKQGGEV